jgi:hypothetical protein
MDGLPYPVSFSVDYPDRVLNRVLVFRQKYPRWSLDWNLELQRFGNRAGAYLALMDDRYPATDDDQSARLDYSYPDAPELNRWLPLVKWPLPYRIK